MEEEEFFADECGDDVTPDEDVILEDENPWRPLTDGNS